MTTPPTPSADHAELRALASKATPGVWQAHVTHVYVAGEGGANICSASDPRASDHVRYCEATYSSAGLSEAFANAAYIAAASPDRVTALLDAPDTATQRIAALEAAKRDLAEWVARWSASNDMLQHPHLETDLRNNLEAMRADAARFMVDLARTTLAAPPA